MNFGFGASTYTHTHTYTQNTKSSFFLHSIEAGFNTMAYYIHMAQNADHVNKAVLLVIKETIEIVDQ